MSHYYNRVALFIDYENFYNSLQKRNRTLVNEYGISPKLDFDQLLSELQNQYGPIYKEDCIVVANFSHYDPQKGGLNRVATIKNVDSFESRTIRREQQSSPGKKYVIENFADMRLAFEIGYHAANNPAELYIICSGDKAFAAIGRALIKTGTNVIFLVPDPSKAAIIIKEQFSWVSFENLMAEANSQPAPAPTNKEKSAKSTNQPVDVLCKVISRLRHEFNTPVPVVLIAAMAGPSQADILMETGRSQGRVDLWTSPDGVECISLQEERMFGKVVPQEVRESFVEKSKILFEIAKIGDESDNNISRAVWRQSIKQNLQISNADAKQILGLLLENKILSDGTLHKPDLSLEKVIGFLRENEN